MSDNNAPNNFKLHEEQIKQTALLERLCTDIGEIKVHVLGDGDRPGLLMDVDRLKQANTIRDKWSWGMITAFTAAVAAYLTDFFTRGN